jgi:RNA polymerase II subunit A-like phosphatase
MSLTNKVTHCIAATLGTEKTYRASKLGVPVLWQGWFWESVNLWERQNEKPWLAIPDQTNTQTPGPSTPTTPALPPQDFGEGWDDEAQAELDAFLDGSSDWGSDAGR